MCQRRRRLGKGRSLTTLEGRGTLLPQRGAKKLFGWCNRCHAIAIDGTCSRHGSTRPLSFVAAIDVRPLSPFEKRFFNERLNHLTLGQGIFLLYSDRMRRRVVIFLDTPLVELRFKLNNVEVEPLAKGYIHGMRVDAFLATNEARLNRMVEVSEAFAEHELRQTKNAVVSYSGGKDSAVLADILSRFGLPKVFIDTRLEFPETYAYINKVRATGHQIDIARASNSFFSLVGKNGYPRSRNRWCCKTQKFEPFARYIREQYGNEDVAVFVGQRRWEALYRLGEPLSRRHRYMPNQVTVMPLLDWLTLDIWGHIWAKELPINPIYEYFDRVGCWLCPFGLGHRVFLLQFTHAKLYKALKKIGGVRSGVGERLAASDGERPCTILLDGERVRTCDLYGHFFVNGHCFRCGIAGANPVPMAVSPASSVSA